MVVASTLLVEVKAISAPKFCKGAEIDLETDKVKTELAVFGLSWSRNSVLCRGYGYILRAYHDLGQFNLKQQVYIIYVTRASSLDMRSTS